MEENRRMIQFITGVLENLITYVSTFSEGSPSGMQEDRDVQVLASTMFNLIKLLGPVVSEELLRFLCMDSIQVRPIRERASFYQQGAAIPQRNIPISEQVSTSSEQFAPSSEQVTPIPIQATKEWQQHTSPGLRTMIISKMADSLPECFVRMELTAKIAITRMLEAYLYEIANSRSEYYHLAAEQIAKIHAEYCMISRYRSTP